MLQFPCAVPLFTTGPCLFSSSGLCPLAVLPGCASLRVFLLYATVGTLFAPFSLIFCAAMLLPFSRAFPPAFHAFLLLRLFRFGACWGVLPVFLRLTLFFLGGDWWLWALVLPVFLRFLTLFWGGTSRSLSSFSLFFYAFSPLFGGPYWYPLFVLPGCASFLRFLPLFSLSVPILGAWGWGALPVFLRFLPLFSSSGGLPLFFYAFCPYGRGPFAHLSSLALFFYAFCSSSALGATEGKGTRSPCFSTLSG